MAIICQLPIYLAAVQISSCKLAGTTQLPNSCIAFLRSAILYVCNTKISSMQCKLKITFGKASRFKTKGIQLRVTSGVSCWLLVSNKNADTCLHLGARRSIFEAHRLVATGSRKNALQQRSSSSSTYRILVSQSGPSGKLLVICITNQVDP